MRKRGLRAALAVVLVTAACGGAAGCGGGGKKRAAPPSVKPAPESAANEQFVLKLASVRTGMRDAKVRKLLGKPDAIDAGLVAGRRVQCWHYDKGGGRRGTRICFRDGKLVASWRLVDGRPEQEVRLLLGRPDSTETTQVKGASAVCWRYDYGVSRTRVCFRGGQEFFKQTLS